MRVWLAYWSPMSVTRGFDFVYLGQPDPEGGAGGDTSSTVRSNTRSGVELESGSGGAKSVHASDNRSKTRC